MIDRRRAGFRSHRCDAWSTIRGMGERAVGIWPSHNGDVVLGRPGGITIGGKLSGAELWAGLGR